MPPGAARRCAPPARLAWGARPASEGFRRHTGPDTAPAAVQIQSDMATSQADHNAAVAIKQNTAGWLQGAPLAAEQADVKASNAALDQAEQLQLQLQQQQVRRAAPSAPARAGWS